MSKSRLTIDLKKGHYNSNPSSDIIHTTCIAHPIDILIFKSNVSAI